MPTKKRGKNGNGKKASGTITKKEFEELEKRANKQWEELLDKRLEEKLQEKLGIKRDQDARDLQALKQVLKQTNRFTQPFISSAPVEMTETSRQIHEEQNKNNNKDKKKKKKNGKKK
jgi:hypothetical protein